MDSFFTCSHRLVNLSQSLQQNDTHYLILNFDDKRERFNLKLDVLM